MRNPGTGWGMAVLTGGGLLLAGGVDVAGGQCIANETTKLTAADTVAGDFDANGAVGLNDFEAFLGCMAGPGAAPNPPLPDCVDACLAAFDSNGDNDVDLHDFTGFQEVFTGL